MVGHRPNKKDMNAGDPHFFNLFIWKGISQGAFLKNKIK
jgi:hypothetical protein